MSKLSDSIGLVLGMKYKKAILLVNWVGNSFGPVPCLIAVPSPIAIETIETLFKIYFLCEIVLEIFESENQCLSIYFNSKRFHFEHFCKNIDTIPVLHYPWLGKNSMIQEQNFIEPE